MLPQTLRAPRLLPSALLAALFLVLPPGGGGWVSAQEDAATAESGDSAEGVEEIVVTGSRIPRKDLEAAAPITVFTRAELDRSGATSIGQLLRELPSIAGQAQTSSVNNGGGGTMQVSLRGLGTVRTLVLLNGRRLPPNVDTGADGVAVDLNTLPTSIVERIEVLKDGASAVYGSDAVAGVVNVITRRGFEGVELNGLFGNSTQGGGMKRELSLTTGGSTENSSWVFVAQYTDEEEIEVNDREWARMPLAAFRGNVVFSGSSAPPWGHYRPVQEMTAVRRGQQVLDPTRAGFAPMPGDIIGVDEGVIATDDDGNRRFDALGNLIFEAPDGDMNDGTVYVRDVNGNLIQAMETDPADSTMMRPSILRRRDGTPILDSMNREQPIYQTVRRTSLTLGPDFAMGADPTMPGSYRRYDSSGADSYNFAPSNFQRQPIERWHLALFGDSRFETLNNLGFIDNATVYMEALYTNRDSVQKLAEVPLAPFAFSGYSGASYSADNAYNPFGYDIVDWRRRMVEDGSRTRDDSEETVRLLVGMKGEFVGFLNGLNWDVNYIHAESERGTNFGSIFNLDRVANAVGPTHRDAEGVLRCGRDAANLISGCVPLNVFGQGVVTQEMLDYVTFTTNEFFKAEQDIWEVTFSHGDLFSLPGGPVGVAFGYHFREETASDTPDSQVATLGDASTGTPRQSTSGGYEVSSWFFEAVLPLLSDAPFAQQLELEVAVRYSDYDTFGTTTDPKFGLKWRPFADLLIRGTTSSAFRAPNVGELFGGAGISFPSESDPCSGGSLGGNVCMDPRVPAAGFEPISNQVRERQGGNADLKAEEADILTAGFVWTPSWFSGFSLSVDYYDIEITSPIGTLGTDFILETCANRGTLCERIDRFADGNVRLVDNRTLNVGGLEAKGFDFLVGYQGIPALGGEIDLRLDGTHVDQHDVIQADNSVIEHAGWFRDGQDGYFAEWRFTLGADYRRGGLRFSYDLRYIQEAEEIYFDGGFREDRQRTVDGRTYHDIQLAYDLERIQTSLILGVDNLFDKDPPLSLDGFNDNTDVRTFDTVGRFLYLKFTRLF